MNCAPKHSAPLGDRVAERPAVPAQPTKVVGDVGGDGGIEVAIAGLAGGEHLVDGREDRSEHRREHGVRAVVERGAHGTTVRVSEHDNETAAKMLYREREGCHGPGGRARPGDPDHEETPGVLAEEHRRWNARIRAGEYGRGRVVVGDRAVVAVGRHMLVMASHELRPDSIGGFPMLRHRSPPARRRDDRQGRVPPSR